MGEVWLAEDTRLGRKVALKLLPSEFTEDSDRVRRFTQEAKAASALNHPNIIAVHDIGESDQGRFIVMEFVDGKTLRHVIAKDNSLEMFFTLSGQMAKALSAAHAAGITHRDIKPDNIMVRNDGYVKMLDFGLARLLPNTSSDPEAATLAQQTTPGTVMGTLAYMSPEQASGLTVSSPSDVFALGIVLYELATGSHPFKSETMIGYLHAITSQTPQSMTRHKSQVPAALDDLIMRMLEKDPERRPTAGEVVQALQEIEKYGSSNTLPLRVVTNQPKASRDEEGFRVAVLPFKLTVPNTEVATLAEGLSEEIMTGLSRFSYLQVISGTSDKAARARYLIEGSIRQSLTALRVAVQLVDTTTGANLWAETYDRAFKPEDIFALQDDLAPRIVSTVADQYGALVHSMSESLRGKCAGEYSAHEAAMRTFGYWERMTPAEHAEVRDILEAAVATSPDHSDCLAELAMIYWHEYAFGYNPRPDPIGRARAAAQRAVSAAPTSHFAHCALATSLFFQKDFLAFRPAAERALALNRMDASTMELLGQMIAYAGDWEYGLSVVERAMQLNPHHPGWYHYLTFCDKYRKHDYHGALASALKVNMPAYHWPHVYLAAVYGQLGEQQRANEALRQLHTLIPNFGAIAREEMGKWLDAELTEHLIDGLRKAGLKIDDEASGQEGEGATWRRGDAATGTSNNPSTASPLHPVASSGVSRADEGFWVAVLPFKFTGSNTDVATLAEGLSEEIITGMSRFSYLRVISRSSTLRYANETSDVRTIGNVLGARYVLEGSLRIAGTSLRVSVQLVDSSTGAHLWVETYKRAIDVDDIFELQDDLAARIVSTIADMNGVLLNSLGEMLRQRRGEDLTPYEAVLRALTYVSRLDAEEHKIIRSALERAVIEAPNQADCWAMLSMTYTDEFKDGFNVQPNSLDRALAAAQRAVGTSPTNHLAYYTLASAFFFRRDLEAFRTAAERAVSLNPMDSASTAFMGILIAYSGDWARGCALVEKGADLNPNHPGWFRFTAYFREYSKRDYRAALQVALDMNMPSYFFTHAALAAAYGQLGELDKAQTALRQLLIQVPNFGAIARESYTKWFGPGELLEDVLDGLRKAGLEIQDASESFVPSTVSNQTRADEGFWIAVLPFKFTGSNVEVAALAEGMSEEIVNGLSRFSYLRVIARGSTLGYSTSTKDLRTVGKELGAGYIMEGSLRLAGTVLRISVQLVDAQTGAQLWAETYDRSFNPESIFQLQDELVPKIVATVGDRHGVLPHTMSEALRNRNVGELRPYEVLLRGFGYFERMNPSEHAALRAALEQVVEQHASSDSWAMLALLYCDEHRFAFNPLPDSLERALAAAQRAVEASVSNSFAHEALAQSYFFRREFDSFRKAAERALALNPFDGATTALMGLLIAYTGDWDYGCALAERATKLNPHHPGWYWNAAFYNAYRKGDYEEALKITLEFNMPGLFYHHVNRAAVYGQLGDREAAGKAVSDLLTLKPDFENTARMELGKWLPPDLLEHLIEGLRKAGVEIPEALPSSDTVSSLTRSDEGFWVAVLPFKYTGSNSDLTSLAEGLSEDIVTGLSRFSYLRVIARGSTLQFANKTTDLRTVGKELGARYVMEGTLRQAGIKLRLSVQLVDAITGAHLWAENYERSFSPDSVFELQDDLVSRIVSTIADLHGVLPRSMSQVVRLKPVDQLSPYEAVLRSFAYTERITAEDLEDALSCLESAIQKAPTYVDALAFLASLYAQDFGQGFELRTDPLLKGESLARKAVELAPSNHFGWYSLAQVLFFQKEVQSFAQAAERSAALNSMDGNSIASLGEMLTFSGNWERGLALVERAKQLNPNHPGWYWYANFHYAYSQHDYKGALDFALRVNLPNHWASHATVAAAYGQLGQRDAATRALRDLLTLRPNASSTVRKDMSKWWTPEDVEHFIDGLRKAGLQDSPG